jgi:hypothetical protein
MPSALSQLASPLFSNSEIVIQPELGVMFIVNVLVVT